MTMPSQNIESTLDSSKSKLQLDRRVLSDHIREYLVNAILNGEFKSGERIIETRIAKDLGVSQGAVREALRELEWLGFLDSKPFRGSFVRYLSADDLHEIYPVRAVLEALGVRLAMSNLSDADLNDLRALVDEMVQLSSAGEERGMIERNYEFHRRIMYASNNFVLIRAWSMFQFSYWTTITTAELHDDLVSLAKRHYTILEALRSRLPDLAAERIQAHYTELIEEINHRSARPSRLNPAKFIGE
jgi:DNA-binding GntR family transcriptional regulator